MYELNFEEPENEFNVYPVCVAANGQKVYEIEDGQKIYVNDN